jgi:hypothetical protein
MIAKNFLDLIKFDKMPVDKETDGSWMGSCQYFIFGMST